MNKQHLEGQTVTHISKPSVPHLLPAVYSTNDPWRLKLILPPFEMTRDLELTLCPLFYLWSCWIGQMRAPDACFWGIWLYFCFHNVACYNTLALADMMRVNGAWILKQLSPTFYSLIGSASTTSGENRVWEFGLMARRERSGQNVQQAWGQTDFFDCQNFLISTPCCTVAAGQLFYLFVELLLVFLIKEQPHTDPHLSIFHGN